MLTMCAAAVEPHAAPVSPAVAVVGADGVWRWVDTPAAIPRALSEAEAAAKRARDPLRLDLVDLNTFDLPIDLHPRVIHWMTHFLGPGRRTFSTWMARGARYQPMMRRELQKAGLPQDLVYVSMIESGYDPLARSTSSAVGLWQFVRSTGEAQGLRIDMWVDERRDPERSLRAAVDYLSDLYGQFGDWRLALAAYNAGPTQVRRAINRTHTRDYWKLVARDQFSAETDDYVAKIMAAAIIGRHAEVYGFTDLPWAPELAYGVVEVHDGPSLDTLATRAGVDLAELRRLNPALSRTTLPPLGWDLHVPVGTEHLFEEPTLDGAASLWAGPP